MAKKFKNLDGGSIRHTYKDLLKWNRERREKVKDLHTQIRIVEQPDINKLQMNTEHVSITWVGHSTFLIQMNGMNIITDPVWAKQMGFEKRLTKPGLGIHDLPNINIVLISHGHYDHLEFSTLRKLKGNPVYYIPSGLGRLFHKKGLYNYVEANWWDAFNEKDVELSFVPAQHWVRRGLLDTDTSHWGGWVLKDTNTNFSIYFVGDTGYFDGFGMIGERYHPNYILMPIGAYEPEWFMSPSHINPEDAVRAFLELDGDCFVPMHYGAYRLADDTGTEALDRLTREWERRELPKEKLNVLAIGETIWIDSTEERSGL